MREGKFRGQKNVCLETLGQLTRDFPFGHIEPQMTLTMMRA